MLPPGVSVLVSKNEEEAFNLYACAGRQELFQVAGARRRQSFKRFIDDMNALMPRQFVQQFKDCAFRR